LRESGTQCVQKESGVHISRLWPESMEMVLKTARRNLPFPNRTATDVATFTYQKITRE